MAGGAGRDREAAAVEPHHQLVGDEAEESHVAGVRQPRRVGAVHHHPLEAGEAGFETFAQRQQLGVPLVDLGGRRSRRPRPGRRSPARFRSSCGGRAPGRRPAGAAGAPRPARCRARRRRWGRGICGRRPPGSRRRARRRRPGSCPPPGPRRKAAARPPRAPGRPPRRPAAGCRSRCWRASGRPGWCGRRSPARRPRPGPRPGRRAAPRSRSRRPLRAGGRGRGSRRARARRRRSGPGNDWRRRGRAAPRCWPRCPRRGKPAGRPAPRRSPPAPARAPFSTAALAARPKPWAEEGLPCWSASQGSMAATTRGSSGVVALLSK